MKTWALSSSALILAVMALRFLAGGKVSMRVRYSLWIPVLLRLLIPVSLLQSPIPELMFFNEAREVVLKDEPRLLLLWALGVGMLLAVFLVTSCVFSMRLCRSRFLLDTDAEFPVYVSPMRETPCAAGLFHPSIYLSLSSAEPGEIHRHVLAHESSHIRHGDLLWSALRILALALHWYNPLVWIAAYLSRLDGELAADEGAVQLLGTEQRFTYGRTLIALSSEGDERRIPGFVGFFGGKRMLETRVRCLTRQEKRARALCALLLVLLLPLSACAFCRGENTQILHALEDARPEIREELSIQEEKREPTIIRRQREQEEVLYSLRLNETENGQEVNILLNQRGFKEHQQLSICLLVDEERLRCWTENEVAP